MKELQTIIRESLNNPEWLDDIIDSLEEKYNTKLSIASKNVTNGNYTVELTNDNYIVHIYPIGKYNSKLKASVQVINSIIRRTELPKIKYYITPEGFYKTNISPQMIIKYTQSQENNNISKHRLFNDLRWTYAFEKFIKKLPNGYVIDDRDLNRKVDKFYNNIARHFKSC